MKTLPNNFYEDVLFDKGCHNHELETTEFFNILFPYDNTIFRENSYEIPINRLHGGNDKYKLKYFNTLFGINPSVVYLISYLLISCIFPKHL